MLGDDDWIDDHFRRAIDLGYGAFCALDKSYICSARSVVSPHVHSAFPLLDLPRETY